MTKITEANKIALREWWSETRDTMRDPIFWIVMGAVALIMVTPWLVEQSEVLWK